MNASNKNIKVSDARPVAEGQRPLDLLIRSAGSFGLCFLGSFMLIITILSANWDNSKVARTVRVPATITKVRMDDKLPWVDYKLTYQGKEYRPGMWSLQDPHIGNPLPPYQAGQVVTAYFNPDHPNDSVIDISYPNVFYDFYGKILTSALCLSYGLGCITFIWLSFRSLSTRVPISIRNLWVPPVVGFVVGFSIIAADMIWYWTHTTPPYSTASYIWFGVPLFIGLLGVIRRDWLVKLLVLGSDYIGPLDYYRAFLK